ncbi:MAG: tetratricopeptide repeat protein [Chthoniobacterales bacterium]
MAVKTEKDLPDNLRATWLKALSAMQLKNYGYTIQLAQMILKTEPSFFDCRQLLRKAAIAKNSNKKSFLGGLSGTSFSGMKIQSLVKKDPLAAIETIEKTLESDPYNTQMNQQLRDAALAAEMPEVATFALETIVEGHPKETKNMHDLAKHYLAVELPKQAVEVYQKILEINPSDLAAVKGEKDASARASMQSGGWEREDADYRDLIKDKDEAKSLEQKSRVVLDDDAIDQQLAELHAKIEANPTHLDSARKIAAFYEQKKDYDNAVQWYDYTNQLGNNSDDAIIRKIADLKIRQYDTAVGQWEDYLKGEISEKEREDGEKELERLRRVRADLLLTDAKTRIERNPTDLQLRYELAEILFEAGQFQEAIPELQKARQNPNVRLRAMHLLGRCFQKKNMLDLAAKTLSDAASEIVSMDSTKKNITYQLGLVYEEMGNMEKSINAMKQIYEVDYGFRDVAARVEGSYTK